MPIVKSAENLEKAAMMRVNLKMTWKAIAKEMGISQTTMWKWRQCSEMTDFLSKISHTLFKESSLNILPTIEKAEGKLFQIADNEKIPAKDRVAALQIVIETKMRQQELVYDMVLAEENEKKIEAMYELINNLGKEKNPWDDLKVVEAE